MAIQRRPSNRYLLQRLKTTELQILRAAITEQNEEYESQLKAIIENTDFNQLAINSDDQRESAGIFIRLTNFYISEKAWVQARATIGKMLDASGNLPDPRKPLQSFAIIQTKVLDLKAGEKTSLGHSNLRHEWNDKPLNRV